MRRLLRRSIRWRWLLIGLLIILMIAVLPVKQEEVYSRVVCAQAEDGWSEPMLLSTSPFRCWFADVAADERGRAHVVWDENLPPSGLGDEGLALIVYTVRDLDGNWSDPNDFTTGWSTQAVRPAITSDRSNQLHVVFRPSHAVYYSQASGEAAYSAHAWRPRTRISGRGITYTPDVAVDSQGVIHVVWSEMVQVELSEEEIFRDRRSSLLSEIFYRQSSDGGVTWSGSVNLSHTPNVGSGRVQIKIDAQDGIHVTWDEGWDRNAMGDLAGFPPAVGLYVHSLDGGHTWTDPLVFDEPRVESVHQPDVYSHYETGLRRLLNRIDRGSYRYSEALVYQKRLVDNISEAREDDADTRHDSSDVIEARRVVFIARLNELALSEVGISFDELCDLDQSETEEEGEQVLENLPQADSAQMTLGLDDDRGVLLVWRSMELQKLYYTWSEDGGVTWSEVGQVPGIYARPWSSPYDAYDTVSDSLGRIHLLIVGTDEPPGERVSPLGVYDLIWDGVAWSDPQLVAYYPGPANPEYPKIAISRGNHLHAVWFVRPEALAQENVQIWYSDLETDAPLKKALPTPIPTPMPTMTPVPTPVPTATPFPTLVPGESGLPDGLYTENDDLGRLALSVSPVLLIVAALVFIRVMWRKWQTR